jgi:hypothetical protein
MMLRGRGYSTKRYETLNTAYHSKPTPLQEASYDVYLIGLVRKDNVEAFSEMMSCGVSSAVIRPSADLRTTPSLIAPTRSVGGTFIKDAPAEDPEALAPMPALKDELMLFHHC